MWSFFTELVKILREFFTKLFGKGRKAYCPVCGQPPSDDAWRCVVCGRKPLCPDHYDPEHQCCQDCVARAIQEGEGPEVLPRDLARIKRQRVRVMVLTPTLIGVALIVGIAVGVTVDLFLTVRRDRILANKLATAATKALKQECYGRAYRLYQLLEAVDRREGKKGQRKIKDKNAVRTRHIFQAVRDGDLQLIDAIITLYPNAVRAEDTEDCLRSPLHWAAVVGNIAVAKYLLRHGANIQAVEAYAGNTPLHLAAKHGRFELAKLLIKKGADVDKVNRCGWPPVNYAARFLLLSDLLCKLSKKKNCLKTEVVDLESEYLRRCTQEKDNLTRIAACYRRERDESPVWKKLKLPVSDQAGPTAPGNSRVIKYRPDTPLHIAAKYGSVEVVKRLLSSGANVNALNQQGHTPLYLARKHCAARPPADCQKVIELLIDAGGKMQ